MESNVGKIDKFIRILASILMLYGTKYLSDSEIAGEVLICLAIGLFSTAIIEFCPLYYTFGFSTTGPVRK